LDSFVLRGAGTRVDDRRWDWSGGSYLELSLVFEVLRVRIVLAAFIALVVSRSTAAAVALLIAIVGAIALTFRERGEQHRQTPSAQTQASKPERPRATDGRAEPAC